MRTRINEILEQIDYLASEIDDSCSVCDIFERAEQIRSEVRKAQLLLVEDFVKMEDYNDLPTEQRIILVRKRLARQAVFDCETCRPNLAGAFIDSTTGKQCICNGYWAVMYDTPIQDIECVKVPREQTLNCFAIVGDREIIATMQGTIIVDIRTNYNAVDNTVRYSENTKYKLEYIESVLATLDDVECIKEDEKSHKLYIVAKNGIATVLGIRCR
ncbi:MAG: hypothetical protein FWF56_03590 [Firmicutes bacterium]|nr:hypothetical protein [Bacillota bacterium]